MKFRRILAMVGMIVVVSLSVGCSGAVSVVTATSAPASSGDPSGSAVGPITGTSVSSGGASGSSTTPGPLVSPTPMTLDATGNLSVGLEDNGGTVLMQVGQRFLLNLGETYNWSFSIDDQTIVSRVINVMTIRGSQGLFEAHKAGTTLLNASGDPQCRQSTPACGMPSITFQIQITVQ
jgi:hypothetical protein